MNIAFVCDLFLVVILCNSISSYFSWLILDLRIDLEIGIWWFSDKLAALREKSYNKTINYSLWGKQQEKRTLELWISVTKPDRGQRPRSDQVISSYSPWIRIYKTVYSPLSWKILRWCDKSHITRVFSIIKKIDLDVIYAYYSQYTKRKHRLICF